jgi:hypothetical protein
MLVAQRDGRCDGLTMPILCGRWDRLAVDDLLSEPTCRRRPSGAISGMPILTVDHANLVFECLVNLRESVENQIQIPFRQKVNRDGTPMQSPPCISDARVTSTSEGKEGVLTSLSMTAGHQPSSSPF